MGLWAVFRLSEVLPEAPLRSVASDIAAGQLFSGDALAALEPRIDGAEHAWVPNPDVLHSVAIIRLREAELDLAAGQTPQKSATFARAEKAVRTALAVAPTDAFLWYALTWLTKNRAGFGPQVSEDLDLSYRTGPHEGWVAVHRNALAVSLLSVLPPELQAQAVDEFRDLAASGFIPDAAAIVSGAGWPVHERLLDALRPTPEIVRAKLAKVLADAGFDVAVPGIDRRPSRPWR